MTTTATHGSAFTVVCRAALLGGMLALGFGHMAGAQEAVRPAPDAERLFTSADAKLHANKQVVYAIIRELLEAGRWERADRYLTERYLQHNPNVASGRASVVKFFVEVLKTKPKPLPEKIRTPVVAVIAEGDLVTVLYPRVEKTPDGRTYSTTWFDTWRIVDGKADEHWDSALVGEGPNIASP
jgi:predicted SnoaL-like aldol condensation-catalyzing enzyme